MKKINLIGCRVRPFMENASRWGYKVSAIDGFNDWDAARFGTLSGSGCAEFGCWNEVLKEYPKLPEGPVLFCGPIENDPALLENANAQREVLNASAKAVAMCRDISFYKTLAGGGVLFPEISTGKIADDNAGWIIKNLLTAGGTGIRKPEEKENNNLKEGEYFQRIVQGVSVGAVFLSSLNDTRLFGITRHIGGDSRFRQKEFLYGGMIYPAEVDKNTYDALNRFGKRAAAGSGITGFWGADFIINETGAHLLEINPRFTASLELPAIAHGLDLVRIQRDAINGRLHPLPEAPSKCIATAVCYAEKDCGMREQEKWLSMYARDIPAEGKKIRKGEPILSLYCEADSHDECLEQLCKNAGKLYGEL